MSLMALAIMLGFGGAMGVCGWCLGYGHAMRKVASWTTDRPVLVFPRDRRFSPVEHRGKLS